MLAGAALALLLGACQAQPPAAPVSAPAAEQALRQRIDAAIGTAACQAASDCRTLALGAKACGGPERWVAWSATGADPAALQGWADELAQIQRKRQAAQGMMSNCSVVTDPGATCVAGRCVLQRSAAAR